MKPKIQTQLFDIVKRLVKWDKKLEIYNNGVDNAYSERVDRLKNNSVTAKMASLLMSQYLIGKGFGVNEELIINKETKETLSEFAEDLNESLVNNRGVYIHINYKVVNEDGRPKYYPTDPKVIPFNSARLGKKDSSKYSGKILLCDDWNDTKENKVSEYDVFNNIQEVVEAQIKKAGAFNKYKGQILYINYDKKYYYPLARIDSVMNDCDSEAQAAIYKNQLLRNGFFGKTLVITKPLIDRDIEEYYIDELGERVVNNDYLVQKSEAEKTKETIESFLGAENAGGAMHIQLDHDGEKFEDAILIKQIESKIDDKMFEFTESSVSKNILMSYCNIPVALVKSPDAALLGNSGEALKEAKLTYWQNTEKERAKFVKILNQILSYIQIKTEVNVIPLIDGTINETDKQTTDTAVQAIV